MRILLKKKQRDIYFSKIKIKAGLSWSLIAEKLRVNERVFRAWRSGEYSIPKYICTKIYKKYKLKIPKAAQVKYQYWHSKEAARKGAYARNRLYGNPGTPDGRIKGGINSIKSQILKHTGFKLIRSISYPVKSELLAEMIGILIGDGGISHYQVTISLGLRTDKEYSYFVKGIADKLFKINASLVIRENNSTINVVINRKALVEFLVSCGLPIGNKVRQEIDIPNWIKKNRAFSRACIRGIFDTDGSVFVDRHTYNKTQYKSLNIALTSASKKLLNSINTIFFNEGYNPKRSSKRSIRLRRTDEVIRFFDMIGSNNPKHRKRFNNFLPKEEYPSGHTGAVSKTAGV